MVEGMISAAAAPITAREPMSSHMAVACEANAAVTRNSTRPSWSAPLRPKRSPSEPVVKSSPAKTSEYTATTHWSCELVACRSRDSVGMATLRLELLTNTSRRLRHSTASVHQRRGSYAERSTSAATAAGEPGVGPGVRVSVIVAFSEGWSPYWDRRYGGGLRFRYNTETPSASQPDFPDSRPMTTTTATPDSPTPPLRADARAQPRAPARGRTGLVHRARSRGVARRDRQARGAGHRHALPPLPRRGRCSRRPCCATASTACAPTPSVASMLPRRSTPWRRGSTRCWCSPPPTAASRPR